MKMTSLAATPRQYPNFRPDDFDKINLDNLNFHAKKGSVVAINVKYRDGLDEDATFGWSKSSNTHKQLKRFYT